MFSQTRIVTTARLAIAAAALALPAASAHAAGVFSSSPITGDADTSVSVGQPFTLAIDVNDNANRTVNGAVFTGTGQGVPNPATNNYSTSGFASGFTGFASAVSGDAGGLMSNFLFNGSPQTLTLNNLRIGQSYTTTLYQASFGPNDAGIRVVDITTSDGGVLNNYDENATPGSELKYTFTATSNSMTLSITPQIGTNTYHLYAASNAVNGYMALLTDNFYAPGNPNTNDVNFNLEARQGGLLAAGAATVAYTPAGNTQVGNPTGAIDNGNYLLVAFGGNSAPNQNFNNALSEGGQLIAFDMAPNSTANGDASVWTGISLGLSSADRNAGINAAVEHFGILFRGDGRIQAFDGSASLDDTTRWTTDTNVTNQLHRIELLLTDSTDFNPFDGVGQTEIAVYADGVFVYSFTKTGGGYADNFINFTSTFIGGVDNLLIAQTVPTPAALPAGLAALSLTAMRRRRR